MKMILMVSMFVVWTLSAYAKQGGSKITPENLESFRYSYMIATADDGNGNIIFKISIVEKDKNHPHGSMLEKLCVTLWVMKDGKSIFSGDIQKIIKDRRAEVTFSVSKDELKNFTLTVGYVIKYGDVVAGWKDVIELKDFERIARPKPESDNIGTE